MVRKGNYILQDVWGHGFEYVTCNENVYASMYN